MWKLGANVIHILQVENLKSNKVLAQNKQYFLFPKWRPHWKREDLNHKLSWTQLEFLNHISVQKALIPHQTSLHEIFHY